MCGWLRGRETAPKIACNYFLLWISKQWQRLLQKGAEHENRYRKLLANVEGGLVFSRDGDMVWQCSNCGHIVIGKNAPEVCPVCAHPKAYFQLKAENY